MTQNHFQELLSVPNFSKMGAHDKFYNREPPLGIPVSSKR